MDNYFDFHFHPLAKNHLAKYQESNKLSETDKKTSAREKLAKVDLGDLTGEITMAKGFMDHTDEIVLRILESQCSVEQLKRGKVNLGVAAISALEFGVASGKSYFSDLMKNNLSKPFDTRYFISVKEGEISYLNLFLKEVEKYIKLGIQLQKEGSLNFLRRKEPKILNKNHPNLVIGIEGGHNLSTKKIGNAREFDAFKEFTVNNSVFNVEKTPAKKPQDVLKWLINQLNKLNIDVLYLSLTHLTHISEQHLATHAFGTKMLKHPSFYPFGNGLSNLGIEVVKTAYTMDGASNVKNPELLLDVKHMSLKSRLDLYKLREATRGLGDSNKATQKTIKGEKLKDFTKIPLIATHVGVTGYSINEWKDNLDLKNCSNHVDQGVRTVKIRTEPKVAGHWGPEDRMEFTFNPCTINLMDEDIIEIANSEGLIGVGLEAESLGHQSMVDKEVETYEFLSTPDFITHFPYNSIRMLDFTDAEEILSEEAWLKPVRNDMHPLGLCLNIVHILAVIGLKANPKNEPHNYICIGSDFDGFIRPIPVCGNSEQMRELESNLLRWLPFAAKKYQEENGGAGDLFEFVDKKRDLKNIVAAILYENGHRFLAERGYFPNSPNHEKPPPVMDQSADLG